MIIDLKTATLDDVAKNYTDVIKHAKENASYLEELNELFAECIGDDNLYTIISHPDAFKAFEDNGLVTWDVLILDILNNIQKLIRAGYDQEDVLLAAAGDIYQGNLCNDECPEYYQDLFDTTSLDHIKKLVGYHHPGIPAQYLNEIVNNIGDLCVESFSGNED